MDIKFKRFLLPTYLFMGLSHLAHASTYTLSLDAGFVKTFSTLGYAVKVEQGCSLNGGTPTYNSSDSQAVASSATAYTLTVGDCPNSSQRVKDIRVKFIKTGAVEHSCDFTVNSNSASVSQRYDVNLFNCEEKNFSNNFLSGETNEDMAADLNIPQSTIARMAPTTYLCNSPETPAGEEIRPFKLENFLKYVDLYDANGQLVKHAPSSQDLAHVDSNNAYLSSNNLESYRGESNLGDAPYYVRIKVYPLKDMPTQSSGFVDIQYWIFYGLNGSQFFRTGGDLVYENGQAGNSKNFVWNSFARHEGDWEHVTVRVNDTFNQILGVFFASHGNGHWVKMSDLEMINDHFSVYSSCNSHAAYEKSGIFVDDSDGTAALSTGATVYCGAWLQIIDEASHSNIR